MIGEVSPRRVRVVLVVYDHPLLGCQIHVLYHQKFLFLGPRAFGDLIEFVHPSVRRVILQVERWDLYFEPCF